jgi:hypothetical protein
MDYSHYSASTLAVHGDDQLNDSTDVAPAMHVSTTYRYPEDPEKLVPFSMDDVVCCHRKQQGQSPITDSLHRWLVVTHSSQESAPTL